MSDEPKKDKKEEKPVPPDKKDDWSDFDWEEAYRQNTRKVVLPPPEECGQES